MTELLVNVTRALNDIGTKKKGTLPPDVGANQPATIALHELLVADILRSNANKRREAALAAVKQFVLPDEIQHVVDETITLDQKVTATLLAEPHYILQLSCAKPAQAFDKEAFIASLRKQGVEEAKIAVALKAGEKRNAPAQSYTVLEL